MRDDKDTELMDRLVRLMASGQLDATAALPVIQELIPESETGDSIAVLLAGIAADDRPSIAGLADHLRHMRRIEVLRLRQEKLQGVEKGEERFTTIGDLPLDVELGCLGVWDSTEGIIQLVSVLSHYRFLRDFGDDVPVISQVVRDELARCWDPIARQLLSCETELAAALIDSAKQQATTRSLEYQTAIGELEVCFVRRKKLLAERIQEILIGDVEIPRESDEVLLAGYLGMAFEKADSPGKRERLIDRILSRPVVYSWPGLFAQSLSAQEIEKAELILTLRFGEQSKVGWLGWKSWVATQVERERLARERLLECYRFYPEMLLVWHQL
ncbi:hypothetical protein N9B94_03135, partial [Verrucomicrobia bacterium]|nr:hypothetical protein [Verrucomicrobiota bacterium]